MSEEKPAYRNTYFAAGVFKLDYKVVGYPELKKVAQEWAKDPCFHELIVRRVSETNFGIQFVYISDQCGRGKIQQFRRDLEERFGKVYGIDCSEMSADPPREDVCDGIVVLKGSIPASPSPDGSI